MGYRMDQMEASVAPPRLNSFASGATARIRRGKSSGIQSPLIRTRRRGMSPAFPANSIYSTNICTSMGTEFQIVTPCREASSSQWEGSFSLSASGSTTAAPESSAPQMS